MRSLPMIVTLYGHVLYTKLHEDSFPIYWAIEGGYGKPTAHAHVVMFDALPVGQKKVMESLRTFVAVETVLYVSR